MEAHLQLLSIVNQIKSNFEKEIENIKGMFSSEQQNNELAALEVTFLELATKREAASKIKGLAEQIYKQATSEMESALINYGIDTNVTPGKEKTLIFDAQGVFLFKRQNKSNPKVDNKKFIAELRRSGVTYQTIAQCTKAAETQNAGSIYHFIE